MARRDRVTRLKSHRKGKNKNPKLSPFQREQKRLKLANQPPIIKPGQRDAPKSQRLVLEYLEAKRKKKEMQREEMRRRRSEMADGALSELKVEVPNRTAPSGAQQWNTFSEEKKNHRKVAQQSSKQDSVKSKHSSLNALLALSLANEGNSAGPSSTSTSTSADHEGNATSAASIIARKKAKKHEKRVKIRQERVKEHIEKMSKELEMLTRKKGKNRKEKGENAAWEKKLRQMQREKELENQKKKKLEKLEKTARAQEELAVSTLLGPGMPSDIMERATMDGLVVPTHTLKGKKDTRGEQSFTSRKTVDSAELEARDAIKGYPFSGEKEAQPSMEGHSHLRSATLNTASSTSRRNGSPNKTSNASSSTSSRKRARDFCDLVDVVHFNERVEGPPVFTCVPNLSASVTRLAKKLEDQGKGVGGRASGKKNPHLRRSLFSDLGALGEQKRLSRLGLLPSSTPKSS